MTKATNKRKVRKAYEILIKAFKELKELGIPIRPAHDLLPGMIMDTGCFVPDPPGGELKVWETIEVLESMKQA